MNTKQIINKLVMQQDLSIEQMQEVMQHMMTGEATHAQIATILSALHIKTESVEEIIAGARVMRQLATPITVTGKHLLDTCGTGGDKSNIFNVSTASAFVASCAGAKVAKHGNRSFLSQSGSADVLEAAGVYLDLSASQVASCIEKIGIGFLFAPQYHGAMRHVAPVRREIGIQTIFNLLGPLANPARATKQLLGVNNIKRIMPMARALAQLGSEHALVINGADGLDEITTATHTCVAELKDSAIHTYIITPEEFGIARQAIGPLKVSSPAQSLALIERAFAGTEGVALDMLALNAGAAIYAADIVASLDAGVTRAKELLLSGVVAQKWREFIELTQELGQEPK
jgi:anthranilate phosphoribosyltransferase